MLFLLGVELAERVAFFGIGSNLITYLSGPMGQSMAAGTAWLLPLVGGFIFGTVPYDCYGFPVPSSSPWGLGSYLYQLHCIRAAKMQEKTPSLGEIVFFYFSLYLVALAQGGIKPCALTFGADQFDEEDEEESKEKSSFFNWWNFFVVGITMLAVLFLNYVQNNLSWELAFGIPSAFVCFAMLVFLLGTRTYRFHIDGHGRSWSSLVIISRFFIKSARDWMGTPDGFVPIKRKLGFVEMSPALAAKHYLHLMVQRKMGSPAFHMKMKQPKAILGLASIWTTCLGYSSFILKSQLCLSSKLQQWTVA